MTLRSSLSSAAAFGAALLLSWSASAAAPVPWNVPAERSLYVETTADKFTGQGPLSLREAVALAGLGGSTTIFLPAGTYALSIRQDRLDTVSTGDLDIVGGPVTIVGAGPGATIVRWDVSVTIGSIFSIRPGAELRVSGLTLTSSRDPVVNNGVLSMDRCRIEENSGTAVQNRGTLRVGRSLFFRNSRGLDNRGDALLQSTTVAGHTLYFAVVAGSGIRNDDQGHLTAVNSTISGNTAGGAEAQGGGLWNGPDARAELLNCTVTDNSLDGGLGKDGAGIYVATPGSVQLRNTIVAGNRLLFEPPDRSDIGGAVESLGHNLIGTTRAASGLIGTDLTDVDAGLAPLDEYGGPVPTHALLPGSPALDAAETTAAPPTDARGVARPYPRGGDADVGAYEASPALYHLRLGGGTASYLEGGPGVPLEPQGRLAIPDDVSLYGASLDVAVGSGAGPGDVLGVGHADEGAGPITVSGTDLYYGPILIGTASGNASQHLVFTFNAAGTAGAVRALLRSISFATETTPATPAYRVVEWQFALAGALPEPEETTVAVVPPNPLGAHPPAVDDLYDVEYASPVQVAAPGILGNDPGRSAGVAVLLVKTTEHGNLTLNPDGSFEYRPWLGFSGTDDFAYFLSDGLSFSPLTRVTLSVAPLDPVSTPGAQVTGHGRLLPPLQKDHLSIGVRCSRAGKVSGHFALRAGTKRWISSREITAVQVRGSRARIFGVEHDSGSRVLCLLELNATPGAPDQFRLERVQQVGSPFVIGPTPLTSSNLVVRQR